MATIRQNGAAQPVAQVDTITIGGTVGGSDTITVTCDNKAVKLTVGATMDTTAEVAAGLAELLNATQHDEQYFTADMTGTAGGYEYPQFRDMLISVSGSVVTLKSAIPGWPFTISVAKTGTLTATHSAEATAATGPWHFDNDDNYVGGSAPSSGDYVVYDARSSSVYFALDNTTTNLSIVRRSSFTGNIGLPEINRNHGALSYPEYRQRYLDTPVAVTTGSNFHSIGDETSELEPVGHTYIDMGTVDGANSNLTVNSAPLSVEGQPAVIIQGGLNCAISVSRGGVGIGLHSDDNPSVINALYLLKNDAAGPPPVVTLKSQSSFDGAAGEARIEHGILKHDAQTPNAVSIDMQGGMVLQEGGNIGTINIRKGAVLRHTGGTVSAAYVYDGGEINYRYGFGGAISAITVYKGFTLRDRGHGTYTTGIDFVGCTPADGIFDVEANKTWTPTAL